jgi:GntR family transcriptional regulator, arabinose operon transcriptional repressor
MSSSDSIPDKSHALRDRLVEEIRSGRQPAGTRMPSEWELARTWQVSRTTVRAALADLAQRGVIVRGQGRGTFVHEDAERILSQRPEIAMRVALVMPADRISNYIIQSTLAAFHQHLDPRVQAAIFHHDELMPERYRQAGADLIIVDGRYDTASMAKLELMQPRLVILNRPHPRLPYVYTDNKHGGELMASHLLAMGHRNIGILHFGEADTEIEFADRVSGINRRLKLDGVVAESVHLKLHAMYEFTPHEASKDLLRHEPALTAVLCVSDSLALRFMECMDENHVAVPDRFSVIGFDDMPAARLSDPSLTTIRQPTAEMGRAMADYCNGILEGRKMRMDQPFRPQLVPRGSVRSLL